MPKKSKAAQVRVIREFLDETVRTDYRKKFPRLPRMYLELIENNVSIREMLELRDRAVKEYYFRPKYILKELTKTLSVSEFIKKARMGITLAQSVYRK